MEVWGERLYFHFLRKGKMKRYVVIMLLFLFAGIQCCSENVQACQHYACNGDDCPFVSTAFFDTAIFVFEIRKNCKKGFESKIQKGENDIAGVKIM